VPELRRPLFFRGEGLPFQAQLEHLLGKDFTNLQNEVFDFG
jgi:hypothetical protein